MCQANSAGGAASDSAGKSDVDRGALECALMAQLKHPNVIAAFKSAQVPLPYEVSFSALNYVMLEDSACFWTEIDNNVCTLNV